MLLPSIVLCVGLAGAKPWWIANPFTQADVAANSTGSTAPTGRRSGGSSILISILGPGGERKLGVGLIPDTWSSGPPSFRCGDLGALGEVAWWYDWEQVDVHGEARHRAQHIACRVGRPLLQLPGGPGAARLRAYCQEEGPGKEGPA
jgi:hypothetical protein